MKNVYISQDLIDAANKYDAASHAPVVLGYDEKSVRAFEQLNPVLSNGHRMNPITQIIDPSVPEEVKQVLMQFIQKRGSVPSSSDLTDEELLASLPSRYMQSQPQLDAVRDALVKYAELIGVGVEPKEPVSDPDVPASEPVASADNNSNAD